VDIEESFSVFTSYSRETTMGHTPCILLGKILTLISILIFSPSVAQATKCIERDVLVDRLQEKFSEQLTAGGLQASRTTQVVIEVWSSVETGTFTLVLTNANGISCIFAAGNNWHTHDLKSLPTRDED